MNRPKTQKEIFYLKEDSKITKQLTDAGIKANQKSVSIIRGMFFGGFTLPQVMEHVTRKSELSQSPTKSGQWKAAKVILETTPPEMFDVLLKKVKYEGDAK